VHAEEARISLVHTAQRDRAQALGNARQVVQVTCFGTDASAEGIDLYSEREVQALKDRTRARAPSFRMKLNEAALRAAESAKRDFNRPDREEVRRRA
jgi:hypothetical protein